MDEMIKFMGKIYGRNDKIYGIKRLYVPKWPWMILGMCEKTVCITDQGNKFSFIRDLMENHGTILSLCYGNRRWMQENVRMIPF